MTVTIPQRVVVQGLTPPTCTAPIRENATQTARVDYMTCSIQDLDLCIAQGADKNYQLYDLPSVDYSLASEITFDILERIGDATVLTKTLSGGDITLVNDYTFSFTITGTESGAMTATRKYCEAWVTLSGGARRIVGAGWFTVEDTGKHD